MTARIDGQALERELGRLANGSGSGPGPGTASGLWRPRRPRLPLTWRLSLSGSPAPTPTASPGAGVSSSGIGHRTCPARCCCASRLPIQADAAGDLDPTTIKLLDRLGWGEISEDSASRAAGRQAGDVAGA